MINFGALPRPIFTASLAAAGLLAWYLSGQQESASVDNQQALPHVPRYFVRDLDMTSMSSEGLPERHVETRYVSQYLDDDTTEMESPRYHFFRSETPPWNVTAEQGWLSADGELALLSGRVTIIRPAGTNSAPFKLVTSDLRIQPDNNYIETDNRVKAKSGDDNIDAVGMQAWMNEPGRIKFLSDVRANYVPR